VPADIAGAFLLVPDVFADERGLFKEVYAQSKYRESGIADLFVQDSVSVSRAHVVRGLHGDPQMDKLVQVLNGEAFDVIVDARRGSPTFRRWQTFELSADNHHQVYVPRGCLHGFQARCDNTVFFYKQTAEYAPARELGVLWNDAALGIPWPEPGRAIVSSKDGGNKSFAAVTGA